MRLIASPVRLANLVLLLLFCGGCADEYVVFHRTTGDPVLLTRRGYSPEECLAQLSKDAADLGVTLSYTHVKGSLSGLSLLWPFEPGYACEAAIGPTDIPRGVYARTSGNAPPLHQ